MLNDIDCSTEGLYRSERRPTSVKTRIIARNQQVVRADRELIDDLDENECSALISSFEKLSAKAGALIISDYGKGVVCEPLMRKITELCSNKSIFVAVDPKERNTHLYKGVSIITPNLKEAHILAGMSMHHHCPNEEVERLGWKIIEKYDIPYLLITLSERGMALFSRENHSCTFLPTVAKKVYDVTGAGDTVISVFTAAITAGATPLEAAFLANHSAGITVSQIGTASVSPEELIEACKEALSL